MRRPHRLRARSRRGPNETGLAPILIILAIVGAVLALGLALWVFGLRARGRRVVPQEPAAEVVLLAPLGGIGETPRTFSWQPVPDAASYKVTIADDDAVWPLFVRNTTEASLIVDEKGAAAITAGRIHAWEVLALDASGASLARGRGRFRVRMPGESPGSEPLF